MTNFNVAPTRVDRNIIFSEHIDSFSIHTNSFNLDNNDIEKKVYKNNVFLNGKKRLLSISLYVGFNSSFTRNQILNSDIYLNDRKIKNDGFTAFNDKKDYKGNPFESNMNPCKKVVTYGMENPDDLFDNIANQPFEDMDNIENIDEYFNIPDKISYPRYYNSYALSRLNSNISVFGTLESVDGGLTTELPLQGLKVEIIKNGIDARKRQVNISNRISKRELQDPSKNKIESFMDDIVEDLPTNDVPILVRNYEYKNTVFNGKTFITLDTSSNSNSNFARLTNTAHYYNDDDLKIIPFNDAREVNIQISSYDDEDVFSMSGNDNNMINGGLPESIAFIGDLL